jgi:hypothetical protein
MPKAALRASAQALPEAKPHPDAEVQDRCRWFRAYGDLEGDIYDLARMLRAADHLQHSSDGEDLKSSACLLYDKAFEMAKSLDQKYQSLAKNRSTAEAVQ